MDGTTYTDFAALLRSVRRGSTVRVYRPFLLGGGKGRTDRQRNLWTERADAIKAKGGCLASINPPLTGYKLIMRAYEEIGNVARGKAGRHKSGRPPEYEFTDHQWEVIAGTWTSRRYANDDERITAIKKRFGKSPGRTTLRNKFGSPHKGRDNS